MYENDVFAKVYHEKITLNYIEKSGLSKKEEFFLVLSRQKIRIRQKKWKRKKW